MGFKKKIMGNSNIPGQGNLASFKKCLPSSKLVTLPQNMNGGPGDLITYFHAKPPGKVFTVVYTGGH